MSAGIEDHEDDLARLVGELTESTLALAALAAALRHHDSTVELDDRHGRVLAALGLAAPAADGWGLTPAAAVVAARAGREYAARFTATLRWAGLLPPPPRVGSTGLSRTWAPRRRSVGGAAWRVGYSSRCWLCVLAIWLIDWRWQVLRRLMSEPGWLPP